MVSTPYAFTEPMYVPFEEYRGMEKEDGEITGGWFTDKGMIVKSHRADDTASDAMIENENGHPSENN